MLVIAVGLALALATVPTCRTTDVRVEEAISAKTKELKGREYCQYRLYETTADLDGDHQEDFVVVFSVEGVGGGGNDSVQYLALFPSSKAWRPVMTKVGQRGVRAVEAISTDPSGQIVLRTAETRDDDPMCCPSGKGELRLKFNGRELEVLEGLGTRR